MNSEQLVLKLGMPWDGRSPRYLTRGFEILSLSSAGTGRSIEVAAQPLLVAQLELFPEGTSYGP